MRRLLIITIIVLVLFAVNPVQADLNSAAQSLNDEFNNNNNLVQEGRQESAAFVQKARAELGQIAGQLDRASAEFDMLKAEFEALLDIENALAEETVDYAEDIKALDNILKAAAKELDQILRDSIITAQYPENRANLTPLLEKNRFPGMNDIENLVQAYFSEIKESGNVAVYDGAYINREGNEVASKILRVGKFESLYSHDGKVGFLRYEPTIGQLLMTSGEPDRKFIKTAETYLTSNSGTLPIDVTGGFIISQQSNEHWFKHIARAGGIVIWPLFAVALAAILICIERLWYLWRIPTHTDNVMKQLSNAIAEGEFDQSLQICDKNRRMPLCTVTRDVVSGFQRHSKVTKELLEDLLDESVLKITPRLEKWLTTLATLGAVSPLLGLLGTVTGMIHTFQSITIFGTSDPRLLAGGISEALVTTEVGLAIAIPVLLVHHFLSRRVEGIEDDLDEKGTALITILRKQVYAKQAA